MHTISLRQLLRRASPAILLTAIFLAVILMATLLVQSNTAIAQSLSLNPMSEASSLAAQTVPVGANFKLPGLGTFSVGGDPAIAFDGENFLVPYITSSHIYAIRIDQDGKILDASPIDISGDLGVTPSYPSVVFDGTNFMIAWMNGSPDNYIFQMYGALVSPTGIVLENPGVVQLTGDAYYNWGRGPSMLWDGEQLVITWINMYGGVLAARFTPELGKLDLPDGIGVITGDFFAANTSIAFDGTNYLIAAVGNPIYSEIGNQIYAARLTQEGEVLDLEGFLVYSAPYSQDSVSVGFDGVNYLLAWYDYTPYLDAALPGSILARRISPDGEMIENAPFLLASQVIRWGVEPLDLLCDSVDCLLIWASPSNMIRGTDIWARRLIQGVAQDPQAIPIAAKWDTQFYPCIGGSSGHYLAAFGDTGISAQRLERQPLTHLDLPPQPALPQASLSTNAAQPSWYADSVPSRGFGAGVAFSTLNAYVVGNGNILSQRTGTWQIDTELAQDGPSTLWASSPNFILSTGGCMFRVYFDGSAWVDHGCMWAPEEFGDQNGTSLWGSSSTDIWGTGVYGALFHIVNSIDDPWTWLDSELRFDLGDLWGTASDNIYAVGERGSILHYDGSDWTQQSNIPTIQRLNAVWGSGPDDIFAVGDWGVILHYDGSSWSLMNSHSFAHLYGVYGTPGGDVFAVGSQGTILRYDGAIWSPENSGVSYDLYTVWSPPEGWPVWAAGAEAQILVREYRNYLLIVHR